MDGLSLVKEQGSIQATMSRNGYSEVGAFILVVIVALAIWGVVSIVKSSGDNRWTGMFESPSYTAVQVAGHFPSKESCLDWLYEQSAHPGANYGFECGKDCTPPVDPLGSYKCSETVD